MFWHKELGGGTFVWVRIQTSMGELNIGSVYAPNERVDHIHIWKWLTTNLEPLNWVLNGDWNMTDLVDDMIGPNTLIHGRKRWAWNRLVDHLDLVDNYLCVGIRIGPFFTWQARKKHCYDQSRLDRSYSSLRNSWCQYIDELAHNGCQTLSDHIPISCTFVLNNPLISSRRKGSYFKVDNNIINVEELEENIKEMWSTYQ